MPSGAVPAVKFRCFIRLKETVYMSVCYLLIEVRKVPFLIYFLFELGVWAHFIHVLLPVWNLNTVSFMVYFLFELGIWAHFTHDLLPVWSLNTVHSYLQSAFTERSSVLIAWFLAYLWSVLNFCSPSLLHRRSTKFSGMSLIEAGSEISSYHFLASYIV